MNTKQSFIGAYARSRPSASSAKAAATEDNPIVIANQESAQVEWSIETPESAPPDSVRPESASHVAVSHDAELAPVASLPDVPLEPETPAAETSPADSEPDPAATDVASYYPGTNDDSIFVIDTMNPTEIRPHVEPAIDSYQSGAVGEVWISEATDQVLRIDSVTMEPLETPTESQPSEPTPDQGAAAEPDQTIDDSREPTAYETTHTPVVQPATDEPLERLPQEPAVEQQAEQGTAEKVAAQEAAVDQAAAQQAAGPATESVVNSKWAGAGWEVDAFDIPRSAIDTFLDPAFFQSLAQKLGAAVENGLHSALITSVNRGEGRSTVAIGTVLAAAANELRIALVDADTGNPHLVDALRLDIESDWLDAIRAGEPLEEVAIASIQDRFTFIPLLDESSHSQRDQVTPLEIDRLVESLRGKFDLVLFDAGPISSPVTRRLAASLDSCFMVKDKRQTQDEDIATAAQMLKQLGIKGVGLIENFCR